MAKIRMKVRVKSPNVGPAARGKFKRKHKELLKQVQRDGQRILRYEVGKAKWEKKGPGSMRPKARVFVDDEGIHFVVEHPAASYQEEGVRPHKMYYLLKARRPVPIELPNGDIIFRMPTEQSMDRGWKHPGIKAKRFTQKAVKRVQKIYTKGMTRTLRESWK